MLGMSIFKRKPRQFKYSPRYYDPEAEAREERKRLVLGENYDEDSKVDDKEYTPGKYIRRAQVNRKRGQDSKTRSSSVMIRLVIFIALLLLIGYYIVSYDGFAKLLGL